jgi:hypothetical protein
VREPPRSASPLSRDTARLGQRRGGVGAEFTKGVPDAQCGAVAVC